MKSTRGMRGCTHFTCNGCSKVKTINQQHIVRASYTLFNPASEEQLMYEIYHVQLCDGCFNDAKSFTYKLEGR